MIEYEWDNNMMTYEFDPKASVIHLRASGILIASDPISYFEAIDNDPSFIPKAEEHIYFTDLDDIQFSYNDITKIGEAFARFNHGDKITKGIFIVDNDLSYGMARMIMAIFEGVFTHFEIKRID